MNGPLRITAALLFIAGLALGASLHKLLAKAPPRPIVTGDPARDKAFAALSGNDASLQTFPAVADLAAESVVSITASRRSEDRGVPEAFRTADSRGSGVVIDEKGHILTNDHVIAGADAIWVTLRDGTRLEPRLVGTDPDTDIALLKVESAGLKSARLGDSDGLRVGEWVLAVGAPFGLANTVTSGIVSAKGRSGMQGPAYQGFIQTDAAVNPGNSGGPLVNLRGEVVGITSSILSRSGEFAGISFAIPINRAKFVVERLKESGTVVRGYIGAMFADVTEDLVRWVNSTTNMRVTSLDDLRKKLRYGDSKGVFVLEALAGGPAQKAGLRLGDLLVAMNGQPIVSQPELKEQIAGLEPGQVVAVKYLRAGELQTATLTVARRPTSR